MVTVYRIGSARVRIMAGDHIPPHVHIGTPDGEVCFDLGSGEVKGEKAARRAARPALAWVKANRAALLAIWREVNG